MEQHATDQRKRDAMLVVAIPCLVASGATVVNQWPTLSFHAGVLAAAGVAFLYIYARGSIELCRKISLVLSLGTWR